MPIYAKTQFKGRVTIKGQENVDLERGCLCVGGHLEIGNGWGLLWPVVDFVLPRWCGLLTLPV